MILIGLALAAIIAGLGWFIRDLPGILASAKSGAIRSKSYGAPIIRREENAELFNSLVAYRRKRLIWPALMVAGGVAFLLLNVWSILQSFAAA